MIYSNLLVVWHNIKIVLSRICRNVNENCVCCEPIVFEFSISLLVFSRKGIWVLCANESEWQEGVVILYSNFKNEFLHIHLTSISCYTLSQTNNILTISMKKKFKLFYSIEIIIKVFSWRKTPMNYTLRLPNQPASQPKEICTAKIGKMGEK